VGTDVGTDVGTGVGTTKGTITIKVIDTGAGISAQDLETIFDPFTQADAGKHRHIMGTGLGLSICKQFIELMGGSIKAESEVGKGSVFTVTIPKTIGDETLVSAAEAEVEPFYAPSAQILVTDDNELNLKVASGFLDLYGIKADTAESGEEALQKVQEKSYDLVFMDHMMPGMDGVETTEAIRALGGDFEKLVIVALTANSLVGSEDVFLTHGLNDYLSKPIDARKMAEVLGRWIPADKMEERPAETEDAPGGSADFLDRLAGIPGVNVEKGMVNFFHKEDMYRDTLKMFCGKVAGDCEAMSGFLADGNIERFTISIHGIKTSLLTLGVSELSLLAYEMEMEAKAGDVAYCQEHFPPFAAQVLDLGRLLAGLFASEAVGAGGGGHGTGGGGVGGGGAGGGGGGGADGSGRPKESAAFLLERLQQYMAAADDLDTDAGAAILTELCGYDWGDVVATLLQDALDATRGFDFDAAVEKAGKVAGLCG
jgi:CheY-like chemotaxis protein